MFTLLLATVLLTHDNPAAHQNAKSSPVSQTITFTGKVPYPTCEMDSYSDRELAQQKARLTCPDNGQVTVNQEHLRMEGDSVGTVWVITYEKKR